MKRKDKETRKQRKTRKQKTKRDRISTEQKRRLRNLIGKKIWKTTKQNILKKEVLSTKKQITLQKTIDKLCNKGIIKLNKASRWKSRMMLKSDKI